MILTELPDLPPRPETPANAAFRRDYVARWTKENTLLCGETRLAEYPRVMHPLSIKMAWGGREVYRLRRREVDVRDGTYLVLNDGDEYGSMLSSERPRLRIRLPTPGPAGRSSRRVGSASKCMEQSVAALPAVSFARSLRRRQPRHAAHALHPRQRWGRAQPALARRRAVLLVSDLLRATWHEHAAPADGEGIDAGRAGWLRLAADYRVAPRGAAARDPGPGGLHVEFHSFATSRCSGATPHAYVVVPHRGSPADAG
jgi:hypothetical protein